MKGNQDVNPVGLLFRLAEGGSASGGDIAAICDWIDGRPDCSDFDIQVLIRMMYQFHDRIDDGTKRKIRKTLVSFKYWLDEPGADGMCYWSENHQLLFAAAEYLAGQLYPDEKFANSGMTGTEHMAKARGRLLRWLSLRWKHGFSEWHSNVYYPANIAPLCNLIDFCRDGAIRRKSEIILDMLMLDMALHSYKGIFAGTKGRTYEVHKKEPRRESTRGITHHLWGETKDAQYSYRLGSFLHLSERYRLPEAIMRIGLDREPAEIRASSGISLDELAAEGISPDTLDGFVFLLGIEAAAHPDIAGKSLDMLERYHLIDNPFFRRWKRWNRPPVRRLLAHPAVARRVLPVPAALQRANTYMYKTCDYSLSTAQNYQPGRSGYQQHVWQATLGDDISIFTTHPAVSREQHLANSKRSPNYWVGNGIMPHSAQHKNVNITMYALPLLKRLTEPKFPHFTHAYFPAPLFDEVVRDENRLFGRYKRTYIALIGKNRLFFHPQDETDLIQKGRETFWICELGTQDADGSFAEFVGRIRSAAVSFDGKSVEYASFGRVLKLVYNDGLYVDGQKTDTEYKRLETPYCVMERKAPDCLIKCGGHGLYLHFEDGIREQFALGG